MESIQNFGNILDGIILYGTGHSWYAAHVREEDELAVYIGGCNGFIKIYGSGKSVKMELIRIIGPVCLVRRRGGIDAEGATFSLG